MVATVYLKVSRFGSKFTVRSGLDRSVTPYKSTVAATGIEKIRNAYSKNGESALKIRLKAIFWWDP